MGKTLLQVHIQLQNVNRLKEYALQNDMSLSQLMRKIIQDWLESHTKPIQSVVANPTLLPKTAIDFTMKHCRKCSGSVPAQEYDDYGGYCVQHGKKTA